MRIFDLIAMCLRNLFRRKMRTMLTVSGVVVGTCAVTVMVSLGLGMSDALDASLSQFSDLTVIDIYNYGYTDNFGTQLDDAALAQIMSMEGVVAATPLYRNYDFSMKFVSGRKERYEAWSNMVGVYPEYMEIFGYQFIEGRGMETNDPSYTMVIGEYADYNFYDTKRSWRTAYVYPEPDVNGVVPDPFVNMMRDKITLVVENYSDEKAKPIEITINVVGRLQEDWSRGWETNQGIFMDVNDYKNLIAQYKKLLGERFDINSINYENAKVKVVDIEAVAGVEQAIRDMGFNTSSMEEYRSQMQEQIRQQQTFLGGLGAVSLLVAALSISNTMIMSIYERTREIGVMKVMGCFVGNIRTIFLMEAGCIGFIGGILGTGISFGLASLLNHISLTGGEGIDFLTGIVDFSTGMPVCVTPMWLLGGAIVFATIIGLLSGLLPSNRAVKISALEAIKHE